MYTKAQVDEMLLQVEQEFEKTLESIAKNELQNEEEIVTEEISNSEEFETIEDLYASMDKSELEAHYSSIKKAMLAKSEDEDEEDEDEDEDEDEEDMEKCGEMSTKKSERAEGRAAEPMNEWRKKVKESADHDEDDSPHALEQKAKAAQKKAAIEAHGVKKSEQSLIKENEELKKNLESLNELVNKLFNSKKAPSQKAITNANFIAKSEEVVEENSIEDLSKNEITSKLKKLDFGSLSKSDRDAINNFYLQNGSVDKIKHLITK